MVRDTTVMHARADVEGDLVEVQGRGWLLEAWGPMARRLGLRTGDVIEIRVIDLTERISHEEE